MDRKYHFQMITSSNALAIKLLTLQLLLSFSLSLLKKLFVIELFQLHPRIAYLFK